jgi:hypothetical protein
MTEQIFSPGKSYDSYDEPFDASQSGVAADLSMFAMSVQVHTHDRCLGVEREPGILQIALEQAKMHAHTSIMEVGATYKSAEDLGKTAASEQGKSNIERKIQVDLAKILDRFCIAVDGVDLTKLKTTDH